MMPTSHSPQAWRERAAFAGLVLLFVALASGYALRTAPWQAPDEPAHYNYIAQLAAGGCCPVISAGDWDSAYLSELTTARFAPETLDRLSSVQYEDHQPPLYYLLLTPVYTLSGGSLLALRLASVGIAALALVLTCLSLRMLLGAARWPVAWAAAAVIAFIPQHLAIAGAVNNDGLAELVVAAALLLALRHLRDGRVPAWVLGVLLGAGLLTKASTVLLAGLLPLALLLRAWLEREAQPRWAAQFVRRAALLAVPALVLGGLWWARNLSVYGPPDVLGLRAHDAVVVDQLRTRTVIADIGVAAYLERGARTTFNSFWGQFGWMALPLPEWTYSAIALFTGVCLLGWLARARAGGRVALADERWQRAGLLLVAALGSAALAQFVYYNFEFYQMQGRYLFPGLIAFGLLLALGLDGWGLLLAKRYPGLRFRVQSLVLLLMPLNLWLLWRIIPLLAP